MPDAIPTSRRTAALVLSVIAAVLAGVLLSGTQAQPAQAQTTPGPVSTVVVRLTGVMTLKMDKDFLRTIKRSKATVRAKSGAKYSGKKRTATLPIDASTAITLSPADVDILAKGTLQLRRPGGRKVTVQDLALRIRDTGADVSSTLRGRPNREFAALTISPTMAIDQNERGAQFIDLQMLVSEDLARAAKIAKIKGVKEGALLGLLSVEVRADLPTFQLPAIPGLDPTTLPGLGDLIPKG